MAKKPGFTIEHHEDLGLELQTMRDRLSKISVELKEAYPSKIHDLAQKAVNTIDTLRSVLDDKVCEENKSSKNLPETYFRASRPDYLP